LTSGCHGLSNHPYSKPYKKTEEGKKIFTEIICQYNQVENLENLESKLFEMLSSEEKNFPDEQMEKQGKSSALKTYHNKLSSIFVNMEAQKYGTRTQTLVFLDFYGKVSFVERTRQDFNQEINWSEKRFSFEFDKN